jgi:heme A synthase
MTTAQVRKPHLAAGNSAFARYAWAVLAYNVAVVLWGAFVRASDSGAGCGNHWPLCQGQIAPHSPTTATIIEFTHRATSGIDLVLVALLLVWALRAFPKHHPARFGAVLSSVFLMTEALIGAALVLLEHVAKNTSPNRAYSLSTHLINTLTLLACLTLTAWWGAGKPRLRIEGRAARLAGFSIAAVVVMGVSGAIAALGDTLFPASSLAVGLAQDFNPASSIFVRLRWMHPALAILCGGWLLYFGLNALRRAETRRAALLLTGLLAAQLLAGAINLLLLAPIWMQIVHLLLADLLWISLVLLCASILSEPHAA